MKKTLLIAALAGLLAGCVTGCNVTRFNQTRISDGQTNTTEVVNKRLFWNSAGYTVVYGTNGTVTVKAQQTGSDSASIQALSAGIAEGMVKGAAAAAK